jgi:hypothetical protein
MPSSYIPDPPETPDGAPPGQVWLCPHCYRCESSRRTLGRCSPISVLVYESSMMVEDGVLISAEAVNDPEAEIVW